MREQETFLFWCSSQAFYAALASGDTEAIETAREDLDLIRDMTDDDAIRRRCSDLIGDGAAAVAVGA